MHRNIRVRLPAEWENQTAVLIAWPHARTDWKKMLPAVDKVYINLATAISRHALCLIVTPEPVRVKRLLAGSMAIASRIRLIKILADGTWIRDYGPITILHKGKPLYIDFEFNGWGRKYGFSRDKQVCSCLVKDRLFPRKQLKKVKLILEGGSIDCDGNGTLMTTSQCLLNPNRNPYLEKSDIERLLKRNLGIKKILWLHHGHIAGDDTDSHIDTLARFAPGRTIVYAACENKKDIHYKSLRKMATELRAFRTTDGRRFKLLPLPWPRPKFDSKGNRMPATYANFLVLNDAVLVPTYKDPADILAMNTIARAYPGRVVYGIDCLPLLVCHGSLHCSTMQIKL